MTEQTTASAERPGPIEVFCSYDRGDEKLRQSLVDHLAPLEREGLIAIWHDRKIAAGHDWEVEIDEHLERADIILLLISANFIASDYCYGVEVKRALQRHDENSARVIPIIVRPVDWRNGPLMGLKPLPTDGRAVMSYRVRDEAFIVIAEGIRAAVDDLLRKKISTTSSRFHNDRGMTASGPYRARNPLQDGREGWRELPEVTQHLRHSEQNNRFSDRWWQDERRSIHEVLRSNPEQGFDQWVIAFAEALLAWELEVCVSLCDEPFPFPPQKADIVLSYRHAIDGIRREQFLLAGVMLDDLTGRLAVDSEGTLLPLTIRVVLYVFAARVCLYSESDRMEEPRQWEKARQLLEQARALAPADGRIQAGLAEYHRIVGDSASAFRLSEESIERSPNVPDGHLIRGLLFEDDKQWHESNKNYRHAIETVHEDASPPRTLRAIDKLLAPVSPNVVLQFARLMQAENPEQAYELVHWSMQLASVRKKRLHISGNPTYLEQTCLRTLGEINEALFRRADAAHFYFLAGESYLINAEHAVAVDMFRRSNSLDSNNTPTYWYLAKALQNDSSNLTTATDEDSSARAKEILNIWDRGFAIGAPDSQYAWAYLTRADALCTLANAEPQLARQYWWNAGVNLEQHLVLVPEDVTAWLKLARVHGLLTNYAVALHAVDQALKYQTDGDPLTRIHALFERAMILTDAMNVNAIDSLETLRQALREVDHDPKYDVSSFVREVEKIAQTFEPIAHYNAGRHADTISLISKMEEELGQASDSLILRYIRADARRQLPDKRDAGLADLRSIWEETDGFNINNIPMESEIGRIRAYVAYVLGFYGEAELIYEKLRSIGGTDPFVASMYVVLCNLGLGEVEKADNSFREVVLDLRHREAADDMLSAMVDLEAQPSISASVAVLEAIKRYTEDLAGRRNILPKLEDEAAAKRELRYIVEVLRPEIGSDAWMCANAGLARMEHKAGLMSLAAAKYRAMLEPIPSETQRSFPEAREALLGLASEEAQLGFDASVRHDLLSTLEHFRRCLELRRSASASARPIDILDWLPGVISNEGQSQTIAAALRSLETDV